MSSEPRSVRLVWRRRLDRWAGALGALCAGTGAGLLALILYDTARSGAHRLSWRLLTSFPSRFPDQAGVKSALAGTLWLLALMLPVILVLGVGAAIYLTELAPQGRWRRLVDLNLHNLAGVPSILYGLLGLAVFVRFFGLGRSVLAGALTMSLLVLPTVVVSAQEALRAVPDSLRQAALALGASRWQMVWGVVLPAAMPGILTGIILALARGMGEGAPLVVIGALTFIAFLPRSPLDPFTVLPIQVFNWVSRPQEEFHQVAAAALLVLLGLVLGINALAAWIRVRYEKGVQGL